MCLTCEYGTQTMEQKRNLLEGSHVIIHLPDGTKYEASKEQIDEIIEHALFVLATGVDCTSDIWAIQWSNDYTVQYKTPSLLTFN